MENKGIGVHVELTANCQSRCLDCGRFVTGSDIVNPYVDTGKKGHITKEAIDNLFDPITCANLRYVNFTGTYGEATMSPEFFDIIHLIADRVEEQLEQRLANGLESQCGFMIETNGGLHTPEYWEELAKIVKTRYHKFSRIIFGIDGTDDETHQMYRRGVPFDNIIANAKAVIDVGVRSEWSMIKFTHNEHQFEEAERMAEEIGFWRFRTRRSRLRSVMPGQKRPLHNVYQKKKSISDTNVFMDKDDVGEIKLDKNDFMWNKPVPDYINETDIVCEWKKDNVISIDYTGRVWQCCYFSTFYHSQVSWPDRLTATKMDFNKKVQDYENLSYYENQYEDQWNNLNSHTLSDIMGHQFFTTDLPDSLNNRIDSEHNPRIFRCGKFCGKKSRDFEGKK